jgi:SSS family solute:Na+ symporter
VLQFAFFLVLGLCLYAFYGGRSIEQLGLRSWDEIFPRFIVDELPTGLAGLVIAGVLASAMGTLSSSISALASATYLDLFQPLRRGRPLGPREQVAWSRGFTLLWGLVLIGGAMLFTDTKNAVVELGLKIASITYGGLLGTFFLGLFVPRTRERDAFVGFGAGLAAMVAVVAWTSVDYTWHTCIGCAATLAAGWLSSLVGGPAGRTRV